MARLDLAVDRLPEFIGQKHLEQLQGRIRICPDPDYLERASDDHKYGRYSRKPWLDIHIPGLLNENLAPTNKHLLSIDMQYAPYQLRASNWENSREGSDQYHCRYPGKIRTGYKTAHNTSSPDDPA